MLGKCWTGAYCRYFRSAVLPLDPVLERSLTVERITETRPCPVCGRAFLPDGRQRYCSPTCARAARRQKQRNRQSRQRLDRHGTIVVGSCETFHHYNVQGVK